MKLRVLDERINYRFSVIVVVALLAVAVGADEGQVVPIDN
jgi:hypothetical protein